MRPYVVGGVGFLRWSQTVAGTRYAGTDARASLGAGVRWRLGDRWGLRPEFKVSVPNRNFARLGISLYYQVR